MSEGETLRGLKEELERCRASQRSYSDRLLQLEAESELLARQLGAAQDQQAHCPPPLPPPSFHPPSPPIPPPSRLPSSHLLLSSPSHPSFPSSPLFPPPLFLCAPLASHPMFASLSASIPSVLAPPTPRSILSSSPLASLLSSLLPHLRLSTSSVAVASVTPPLHTRFDRYDSTWRRSSPPLHRNFPTLRGSPHNSRRATPSSLPFPPSTPS